MVVYGKNAFGAQGIVFAAIPGEATREESVVTQVLIIHPWSKVLGGASRVGLEHLICVRLCKNVILVCL